MLPFILSCNTDHHCTGWSSITHNPIHSATCITSQCEYPSISNLANISYLQIATTRLPAIKSLWTKGAPMHVLRDTVFALPKHVATDKRHRHGQHAQMPTPAQLCLCYDRQRTIWVARSLCWFGLLFRPFPCLQTKLGQHEKSYYQLTSITNTREIWSCQVHHRITNFTETENRQPNLLILQYLIICYIHVH